jgi:hypothetical protein
VIVGLPEKKKADSQPTGWATADETKFLDNIGSYSEVTVIPRELLLEKYEQAAHLRVNWGRIKPDEVMVHVKELRGTLKVGTIG